MLEEHFIEWITLNTNQGVYRKQLNPGQEPVADFCLCDGEQVEEVYAYCNLHGLWKCYNKLCIYEYYRVIRIQKQNSCE